VQFLRDTINDAREASRWRQANRGLFSGTIQQPFVATADDSHLRQWVDEVVRRNVSDDQVRDAALFNFSNATDIVLFIQLVTRGLGISCNVCLNGQEYISNNAGGWWDGV